MAYNELILSQEDKACFQIPEEVKTYKLPNGDASKAWQKLPRKFDPTTGASKKKLCKKNANSKLKDATRDPKDLTKQLDLLRGTQENYTSILMAQKW